MYQNIFYDRTENTIHLWDDVDGYSKFKYQRYAYIKDNSGNFTSLYGDSLKKVYKYDRNSDGVFEGDVNEYTRTLVDRYLNSDDVSNGHRILTFDIEVEMHTHEINVKNADNYITSIAFHDSKSDSYCILILDLDGVLENKRDGNRLILPYRTEKELLSSFISFYNKISPTIITGWNIDHFDVPYLYNRMVKVLGSDMANKLSPVGIVQYNSTMELYKIAGVSALDYLALYKNYNYSELPNYRLDTVGTIEVGMGKIAYDGNLDDLFKQDIDKFIEYNLVDVLIVVELDKKLQFIDLCRGICHVGHVPYEDFQYSSRYLEGALLCYLKRRGIVAPNKPKSVENDGQFAGAYVKDPIVNKYKWVYDLDLTSLYPSIIMSLNVSPETKVAKVDNWDAKAYISNKAIEYTVDGSVISKDKLTEFLNDMNLSIAANGVMYKQTSAGCIPAILDDWFNKRVEYRKLEKQYGKSGDTENYNFYKKRQLVQKILLNSMYGCLGLSTFRFYDRDNAEAVTVTGQLVITTTADFVNLKYNKELGTREFTDYNIYIDTDSIFFSAVPLMDKRIPNWRNSEQDVIAGYVNDIAGEVQDSINLFYNTFAKRIFNVSSHRFEIKKEYVAKAGLWVAKKRYALWIISDNGVPVDKLDVKGLDVKRSSFPKKFQDVMSDALINILKDYEETDVTKSIVDLKNGMSECNIADVAKNTAVKELSKYEMVGRKRFYFKKGTPAHVKAAISYNDFLDEVGAGFNYQRLRNGDKVKWVYLNKNPYGIEGMAFTGYVDPKEVTDFIKKYVDHDKMFEREFKSKMQDIYTAVGWGSVIKDNSVSNQFFNF